ncbi:MAG: iron-sulfur cluster assembly scaffold protein [Desulfopila sp.]
MNNKELDAFVDKLQQDIFDEAHRAYGQKGYERWLNPRFCHQMQDCDSHAALTGECGDTIEIFIIMDGETLQEGSYTTTGCASSSICGSFAVEVALGKTAAEILDMNGATILEKIGSFPKDEEHCAHLAITTMKEAINKYMRQQTTGRNTI